MTVVAQFTHTVIPPEAEALRQEVRDWVRTFVRKFEEALSGGDLTLAKAAFIEAQSESNSGKTLA